MGTLFLVLLTLTGMFLMFIILLQRGRGGGLVGALGGAGGQSAFGTKAGDVFTKITIGVAVVWVVLASAAGFFTVTDSMYAGGAAVKTQSEIGPADEKDSDEAKTDDEEFGRILYESAAENDGSDEKAKKAASSDAPPSETESEAPEGDP